MALTGTVELEASMPSMDSSAMHRRRHAGMKSPDRDDTERDETRSTSSWETAKGGSIRSARAPQECSFWKACTTATNTFK